MGLIFENIWWIAALISSVSTAAIYLVSQYSNVEGNLTVFWRGVFPFVFITPLLFFIDIPTSPYFYIAAILTSFIASYSDVKYMNGAIKFGAGNSLRIKPYSLWIVFIGWFVISSSYRENFLSQPIEALGILVSLVVLVISSSYMKKCEISRAALIFFFPAIVATASMSLLNKIAMDNSSLLGGILLYSWIQGLIILCVCISKNFINPEKKVSTFFEKNVLVTGGTIGCLFIVANISKNTAMTYTENPAYVAAIILTSPIWTTCFYWLRNKEDQGNKLIGWVIVASSVMLILLS